MVGTTPASANMRDGSMQDEMLSFDRLHRPLSVMGKVN